MPTYRNDSPNSSKRIVDYLDKTRYIDPGNTVRSFQDVSADAEWTQTSASPANVKTITGQNEWTDPIPVQQDRFELNLSIEGISGDTVTLQRSFDGGVTWKDVESYTADTESYIQDAEQKTRYRVGVKTGDYGAGTIIVRLGK